MPHASYIGCVAMIAVLESASDGVKGHRVGPQHQSIRGERDLITYGERDAYIYSILEIPRWRYSRTRRICRLVGILVRDAKYTAVRTALGEIRKPVPLSVCVILCFYIYYTLFSRDRQRESVIYLTLVQRQVLWCMCIRSKIL